MISLDRFEEQRRQRLPDRSFPTGPGATSLWIFLLFAGIFTLAGGILLRRELGVFESGSQGTPGSWSWAVMGGSFCLTGIGIAVLAWNRLRAHHRQPKVTGNSAQDRAFLDRDWNPVHTKISRWAPLWAPLGSTLFLIAFLTPFHCFILGEEPKNGFALAALALFDVTIVVCGWKTLVKFLHGLRYGHSRVSFASFPCFKEEPIQLQWHPPSGLNQVTQGHFTLRCIEQAYIERETHGRETDRELVTEQLWSGTWIQDLPQSYRHVPQVDLTFTVDPELPATHLRRSPSHFWELEVKLKTDGPDFEATYLLPIYSSKGLAK